MTAEEAAVFESGPLFKTCVRMREYDEAAKVVGKHVPAFEAYRDLIVAALRQSPKAASECQGSFVRDGNALLSVNALLLAL